MADQLAACPFCSGEAQLDPYRERSAVTGQNEDAAVVCRVCDAEVFGTTDAEAFAAGAEAMRKMAADACAGTYAKTAFEFELGTACQKAILSLPAPTMEEPTK